MRTFFPEDCYGKDRYVRSFMAATTEIELDPFCQLAFVMKATLPEQSHSMHFPSEFS
jgi:hypothetical protein